MRCVGGRIGGGIIMRLMWVIQEDGGEVRRGKQGTRVGEGDNLIVQ